MVSFDGRYKVTEAASSKNPGDWGRAMAKAMADLAGQGADEERGGGYESLYGEELHLVVRETDDGVRIKLSWTPGSVE